MSEPVDRAMLNCIYNNSLILPHESKNLTIALIGESSKSLKSNTLRHKLKKKYYFKTITVFTRADKFKIEDGERFDILIGVRSCDAEKLILESATKYGKQFILMPCTCNGIHVKVVEYIRKYSVIKCIDGWAPVYKNSKTDRAARLILYNRRKRSEPRYT